MRRWLDGIGGICCRPCRSFIVVGERASVGSQSPQPHLEDGSVYRQNRPGRQGFERYDPDNLHKGLSPEESQVLARSPHIEQAVSLVMLGLHRLRNGLHYGSSQEGE